jgi:hypothetical protein
MLSFIIVNLQLSTIMRDRTEMFRINILFGTNVKKVQNYLKNQIYISLSDT